MNDVKGAPDRNAMSFVQEEEEEENLSKLSAQSNGKDNLAQSSKSDGFTSNNRELESHMELAEQILYEKRDLFKKLAYL